MRFYNKIFIFIFFLMMILPLVFVNLSSERISVLENRRLESFPLISDLKKHPDIFIREFDAWFKDSTGFREKLINLYKKTYGFLSSSYLDGTSKVIIGKEGHHFNTHFNLLLPIWQGQRWLDDTRLYELSAKLNNINKYLSGKNIPFVFMLCTDKESVYPEYYSDFVIKGPDPTSLDAVTDYISANTNIDFFCIKESLLREKENRLLYPKTGDIYALCHYNETGSFIAYMELMKHINKYFPNLKSFTFDDVDIKYFANGSSKLNLKQEKKYKKIEARFFDDAVEFENEDLSLPVILFICDSYTNWFPDYLPQHFGRVIMHNFNYVTLEHFQEYIDLYKPDIVVFESAERVIRVFANQVIDILELP